MKHSILNLDGETTAKAELYAQRNHITVNTIMQGVWSYLLHRYTGSGDVVFGVIVSGRPDELPGIEQRVGMYINTLPLHSNLTKENKTSDQISKWLKQIQDDQVLSRHYQYTPLSEIQRWAGIGGDLFDSILIFENYPVSEIIRSKEWKLKS